MVVISNGGASLRLLGVRQVLRAIVASSAIRVEKLWAGVPSLMVWVRALVRAKSDRVAGATGSREMDSGNSGRQNRRP